jgi:hypothetical protein
MKTYLFVHLDKSDNLEFKAYNLLSAVDAYTSFVSDTCINPDWLVAILEMPC